MIRVVPLMILAAFVLVRTAAAQTESDRRKAHDLGVEGIRAVDAGELNKGLDLLKQAAALDPGNPIYPYEQAYIYVKKTEYATAVGIITSLLADSAGNAAAEDLWYQLLANCYDYMGDSKKAVATYEAGLKRFPDSGPLHLELGVMALKESEYDRAMSYWEQGIQHAPKFPSNYYWAARLFCNSTEKMWGLLYGEIFMNLEPNSHRTEEISRLLFETYNKGIVINKDSAHVNLVSNTIVIDPANKAPKLPLSVYYGTCMSVSAAAVTLDRHLNSVSDKELSLSELNTIRSGFVKNWHDGEMGKEHSVVLFGHQRALHDAGQLEAYNYWLLSQGSPEEFETWASKNEEKFRSFAQWMRKNRIMIDKDNYFSRLKQ